MIHREIEFLNLLIHIGKRELKRRKIDARHDDRKAGKIPHQRQLKGGVEEIDFSSRE